MSRCDDKRLTRRLVAEAGIAVPEGPAGHLRRRRPRVPRRGRRRRGQADPRRAGQGHHRRRRRSRRTRRGAGPGPRAASRGADRAARGRRRPAAGGDRRQGRRRRAAHARRGRRHRAPHRARADRGARAGAARAATGGESRIPVDDVTEATVSEAGWSFDDVLPEGERLRVRRTANLHQGGTIHDVTAEVNPELCEVAVTAAEAIGIPVTGIDLLVPDVDRRPIRLHRGQRAPGLANHEPQPTAQAFVDYLFPGIPACRRRGRRTRRLSSALTRCWCASRSRRPAARWTPARCACRAGRPAGSRRRRSAGWRARPRARRAC